MFNVSELLQSVFGKPLLNTQGLTNSQASINTQASTTAGNTYTTSTTTTGGNLGYTIYSSPGLTGANGIVGSPGLQGQTGHVGLSGVWAAYMYPQEKIEFGFKIKFKIKEAKLSHGWTVDDVAKEELVLKKLL